MLFAYDPQGGSHQSVLQVKRNKKTTFQAKSGKDQERSLNPAELHQQDSTNHEIKKALKKDPQKNPLMIILQEYQVKMRVRVESQASVWGYYMLLSMRRVGFNPCPSCSDKYLFKNYYVWLAAKMMFEKGWCVCAKSKYLFSI